ncbi:hypothetical protein OE88DRAFT_1736195 [Heliocybe sulcata]|uniref:Uncharacterized protein n=1 Tax=Heliocybe sulcata TaxID=5364 RepID=A0A5C3NA44_9AGAM|nr:hypothetical protein OE88DRAFT_1736195 [Heliocybe sulcata]
MGDESRTEGIEVTTTTEEVALTNDVVGNEEGAMPETPESDYEGSQYDPEPGLESEERFGMMRDEGDVTNHAAIEVISEGEDEYDQERCYAMHEVEDTDMPNWIPTTKESGDENNLDCMEVGPAFNSHPWGSLQYSEGTEIDRSTLTVATDGPTVSETPICAVEDPQVRIAALEHHVRVLNHEIQMKDVMIRSLMDDNKMLREANLVLSTQTELVDSLRADIVRLQDRLDREEYGNIPQLYAANDDKGTRLSKAQEGGGEPPIRGRLVLRERPGFRPLREPIERCCMVAYITINGVCALVLFDTGSTLDCVSPEFAQVANLTCYELGNPTVLQLGTVGSRSKIN